MSCDALSINLLRLPHIATAFIFSSDIAFKLNLYYRCYLREGEGGRLRLCCKSYTRHAKDVVSFSLGFFAKKKKKKHND